MFCGSVLSSILQTSAPSVQADACLTLQVPSDQSASPALTPSTRDQAVITTMRIDAISIVTLSGLTSLGFVAATLPSKVFLTSSPKPVSHFCNVIRLPKQPHERLRIFRYFLPIFGLKMEIKATKTPTISRIINAAIQTILLCHPLECGNSFVDVTRTNVIPERKTNQWRIMHFMVEIIMHTEITSTRHDALAR